MENENKDMKENRQNRNIAKKPMLSDPVRESVGTSIAMGIDTFDTPLPIKFNTTGQED